VRRLEGKKKTEVHNILPLQSKIINFTPLNAAFGSPPSQDLTGQAIINHKLPIP
jgi:hypothetical protein